MIPQTVWTGADALTHAETDICVLGNKALIVAGQSMIRQGHMKRLTELLERNNKEWEIYTGISGEPTDQMIEAGTKTYHEKQCDFIIGFGGGSPLDSAKAISILSVMGEKIADLVGKEISCCVPPVAAIPTTAGTGSEVTQFTIIIDTQTDIKMLLKGSSLVPAVAVIDPVFTVQAGEKVTVAAVKRIFHFLPLVLQSPSDLKYREQMAIAAYEAGVSFSNSSVTLIHGMSRPIGAVFHVPHGLSNAMLLPKCLEYAATGAYGRFGELGRVIGVAGEQDSDADSAHQFIFALKELCLLCHVPTLAEYGIDKETFMGKIDKMAADAMESGSPSNTLKYIDKKIIAELYRSLWEE